MLIHGSQYNLVQADMRPLRFSVAGLTGFPGWASVLMKPQWNNNWGDLYRHWVFIQMTNKPPAKLQVFTSFSSNQYNTDLSAAGCIQSNDCYTSWCLFNHWHYLWYTGAVVLSVKVWKLYSLDFHFSHQLEWKNLTVPMGVCLHASWFIVSVNYKLWVVVLLS